MSRDAGASAEREYEVSSTYKVTGVAYVRARSAACIGTEYAERLRAALNPERPT